MALRTILECIERFCPSAFSFFASPKQTMTNSRVLLPEPNFRLGAGVGLIYVSAERLYAQSASDLMIRRRRPTPYIRGRTSSSEVGNTIDPKRTLCLMAWR